MDRVAAIVQFLKTQTSVTDVVGQRIFDHEIPDAAVARMPRPTVVVMYGGGGRSIGGPQNDFSDGRIDVRCYAWKTKNSAAEIEELVYNVLRRVTRKVVGNALIHWCRDASGVSVGREPTAPLLPGVPVDQSRSWPYAFRSWQVLAADIPVPV